MRMLSLLLCLAFLLVGCAGSSDSRDVDACEVVEEVAADVSGGEVILGQACESAADCDAITVCTLKASCVDNLCLYEFKAAGTACDDGCRIDGECSANGTCINTVAKECPEVDGSICTVPTCLDPNGDCVEVAIDDGDPPYVLSDCLDGVICVAGKQDNSQATPSELAEECAAQAKGLDPLGCLANVICVGGATGCKEVYEEDGTQCWTGDDDADGPQCLGHSCSAGECVPDEALDAACTAADLPEECGPGCQQCTTLECHWIADPANPENPTKKVRYCQPTAAIQEPCTADPCMVDEACAFGSQADGPLGKETLGSCTGGTAKSPEQCATELGKPPLPCILAGLSCVADQGGCLYAAALADSFCMPPEWKCFDKENTYCSATNTGENWDAESGCQVGWVEIDCDDDNECTVDSCKNLEDGWGCNHQPLDGVACDDGDACTLEDLCVEGVCIGAIPACADEDDDPCNDPACDAETGECLPPQTDGLACDDENVCTTVDLCVNAQCAGGFPLNCNDDNPCTDDGCDPATGCANTPNSAPCNDGDASTVGDQCEDGFCQPGAPINCDDNNVCTDDTPDPVAGCIHTSNSGPCDDNDVCTVGDTCAGGGCISGTALDCDDNQYCTVDSCHPISGCQFTALPDYTPCPGGLAYGCIDGVCTCLPECSGKECGDDLCGGSCGSCPNGQQCVNGQCQGGEFEPSGTYTLTPAPSYSCAFGLVTINLYSIQLVDNGNTLSVNPAMNGCCTLTGDSAADGSFTASCLCPGGCNENYTLTGTFTNDTTWTGTFTANFTGSCWGCTYYSQSVTAQK